MEVGMASREAVFVKSLDFTKDVNSPPTVSNKEYPVIAARPTFIASLQAKKEDQETERAKSL
jgi:hypothetical protein